MIIPKVIELIRHKYKPSDATRSTPMQRMIRLVVLCCFLFLKGCITILF
ncbi:hypothetical protein ACFL1B_04545 [Nanoarchaeota archaeon]